MPRVPLGRVAAMFAWIGLTSIGSGRVAYLYEALVVRRAFLSREEFLPGLAVSQVLPGPTVSNLAAFLGHGLRGAAGAATAVVGMVLPGALLILAGSALYFGYGTGPAVDAALRGMGAAATGFLCVTTVSMSRGAFGGRGAVAVAALTFAGVGLLRLNTFLVLAVTGTLSLWLNRPARAAEGRPPEDAPR